MRQEHLREKPTCVFSNSMAAKGLSEDVILELVPLTCLVGLSAEDVASCAIDLKLLSIVSFSTWTQSARQFTILAALLESISPAVDVGFG